MITSPRQANRPTSAGCEYRCNYPGVRRAWAGRPTLQPAEKPALQGGCAQCRSELDKHRAVFYREPNAGKPRLENMKIIYDESPEQMVKGLVPLLEAGANVVGACCGSTPDHIRAFRKTMDEYLNSKQ